jgi:4-alpha-glucanotransferase
VNWTDADGRTQEVSHDTLREVLRALGLPCDSSAQIAQSQSELRRQARTIPKLLTACANGTAVLGRATRAHIRAKGAQWQDLELLPASTGWVKFRAPIEIGYYEMEVDGSAHTLAVAPSRCFEISDVAPNRKLAGLSVQLYALRGGHSEGFGDFAALGEFATRAGAHDINAITISPMHAGFAADLSRFSPYAPSSRFFLDPLYADAMLVDSDAGERDSSSSAKNVSPLIDWTGAKARKFQKLLASYDRFLSQQGEQGNSFQTFCVNGGRRLRDHAVFEALDANFRETGMSSFSLWPPRYRNPDNREVREFAECENKEVRYHMFLQWLTARSAAAAQRSARARMAIGIISDVAVGVDKVGSHAWSAPGDLLSGLSIGAPPDAFNAEGQDWGVTTFSPAALKGSGYESFIETIRAAMRHAGGIRIDHAMGLRRLWVLPDGASPREGAYITYPEVDLIRLIALESQLNKAIVIGEDLGTVPEGFQAAIANAGMLGMRVLWFERDREGHFITPERWDSQAAALTTTHDLPTVAGWWRGHDIEWRAKIYANKRIRSAERRARKTDRYRLWKALTQAECARGTEPAGDDAEPVLDAALCYVSKTPSPLAMASVEDIAGLSEQPNLPGTAGEHPNWRRRLPPEDIWRNTKVRARLGRLASGRKQ